MAEKIDGVWNITVYHLTNENMESIYNTLRFSGVNIHPYGSKENKKLGLAISRNCNEFIVGVGDYIAVNNDTSKLQPIPILKQHLSESISILLSQFGQLTIKE